MNILKIVVAFALTASVAFAQALTPQGRLTLVASTPVMASDVTGATAVYYYPYVGTTIPISNSNTSITFVNQPILPNVGLTLSSTNHLAGKIYDVYGFMNSGELHLGTGVAWSSSSARSDEQNLTSGIVVNETAITLTDGSNTYNVPAFEATYLGSVYMTANGQTSMQLKPSAASGGTNNVLGVYNAYNRVRVTAYCRDNAGSWNYSTATWRAANGASGNTNNKISFLDGLQESQVTGNYSIMGYTSTNTIGEYIGLNVDSSTTTPDIAATMAGTGGANQYSVTETFYPLLGLHYVQAVEYASGSGTASFYATNVGQQMMALAVTLDM
jgi:hypothetical protein